MLTKNKLIEGIAPRITYSGLSLPELVDKYLTIRGNPSRVFLTDAIGLIGELQIGSALEEICNGDDRINLSPLRSGQVSTSGRYKAVKRPRSSIRIMDVETGKDVCEFDRIIKAGNLHVIIESRLSKRYELKEIYGYTVKDLEDLSDEEKRKKVEELGLQTENLMDKHNLRRYEPIINDFSGSPDFGFVLVIYGDYIDEKRRVREDYFEAGGLVVPFFMGKDHDPEKFGNLGLGFSNELVKEFRSRGIAVRTRHRSKNPEENKREKNGSKGMVDRRGNGWWSGNNIGH